MLTTNFTLVPKASQSFPGYKEKKEANILLYPSCPISTEKVKIQNSVHKSLVKSPPTPNPAPPHRTQMEPSRGGHSQN